MADAQAAIVAAIVPAYNEEETIADVVRILVASHVFQDVIVVSDGSTDRTAERARSAGASLVIEHPTNRGKGTAMRSGVSRTRADVLFFCDADIIDLTDEHLRRILDPVRSGTLAMNVGLYDRGPRLTRIASRLPLTSGQRSMRREVFEQIPEKYLRGFRVEIAMNYICRIHRLAYGSVVLPAFHFRRKIQKVGVLFGLAGYIRMWYEVAAAMLGVRWAHLIGRFV